MHSNTQEQGASPPNPPDEPDWIGGGLSIEIMLGFARARCRTPLEFKHIRKAFKELEEFREERKSLNTSLGANSDASTCR